MADQVRHDIAFLIDAKAQMALKKLVNFISAISIILY